MNAIIFSNLLKDQQALRNLDPDILEALLEQYPYSQPIQRLIALKTALTLADDKSPVESSKIDHLPFFSNSSSIISDEIEINSNEMVADNNPVPIEADLEEEVLYFDTPDRKVDGISWQIAAPNEISMGKKKNKKIIEKIRRKVLKTAVQPDNERIESKTNKTVASEKLPNPKANFRSWIDAHPQINEEEEEEDINIPEFDRIELYPAKPSKKEKTADSLKEEKKKIKAKKSKVKDKSGKKKKKKKEPETKAKNATNTGENSKKKSKVKHFARESIKNKPSLISETLAVLLAKQGHLEKSIAMYEKLRLLIPEKSHFFASQIEKLKNI